MRDPAGAARFFNTAGPMDPEEHYCIPPLRRMKRGELLTLIRKKRYFVLHAPRQTGKTSALLALRDLLNGGAEGAYRCVYVNLEHGQASRENTERAMRAILGTLARRARTTLGDASLAGLWPDVLDTFGPDGALYEVLARWAEANPTPLVLLIDEIDALIGDTLLSVLRQLRAGYDERPAGFPQSVILCGVRDVRDYRIRSTRDNAIVTGGSAFNVKAKSLRLGDFSESEVRALLNQHTVETGQRWTAEALDQVWELTQGQPWLVNALADQACFEDPAGHDRSRALAAEAVQRAREQLILRRDTHLDQLTDKLQEERVHRVIAPLLSGSADPEVRPDDIQYVRDLGLVARDAPVRIANPIYREVIPRDLTLDRQETLPHDPAWYVDDAGNLVLADLLAAFQEFFREHSEHWIGRFQYREAGPLLLLQAFLQRIVNSGGRIEREYGLGMMRTDLLIVWPASAPPDGRQRKMVIECKVLHHSLDRTISEGLKQTRAYLDRCGAAEGHLVIFDRTPDRPWEQKLFRREPAGAGPPITTWGM